MDRILHHCEAGLQHTMHQYKASGNAYRVYCTCSEVWYCDCCAMSVELRCCIRYFWCCVLQLPVLPIVQLIKEICNTKISQF